MRKKKGIMGLLISMVFIIFFITISNSGIQNFDVVQSQPLTTDPKTITVTNPTGFSEWEMGSEYTITWTSTGDIPSVYIDLYKDNNNKRGITIQTPNDGSYTWFIPNDLNPGDNFQVVIGDIWEPSLLGFSEYFNITGTQEPEIIRITTPNHTTSWQITTVNTIRWVSQGVSGSVYIDLYIGTKMIDDIYMYVTNDGSYDWFIPNDLEDGTDYRIKIGDVYDYYLSNFSEYFEIYTTPEPKEITITNPYSLSSWKSGSSRSILWTSTGEIESVTLELYKEGSFLEEITSGTLNDGSYNWHIPSHIEQGNSYRIKMYETSNSSIYDYSESFSIVNSTNLPQIIIISPTSESIWETGSEYLIQWNCSQQPTSYDLVNIRLYKRNDMILTIAEQEQNSNDYFFTIPHDIELADDYRIYVQLLDGLDKIYKFSTYFTITNDSVADDQNNFIPGYDIVILLGIVSLVSYVLFKKHSK